MTRKVPMKRVRDSARQSRQLDKQLEEMNSDWQVEVARSAGGDDGVAKGKSNKIQQHALDAAALPSPLRHKSNGIGKQGPINLNGQESKNLQPFRRHPPCPLLLDWRPQRLTPSHS